MSVELDEELGALLGELLAIASFIPDATRERAEYSRISRALHDGNPQAVVVLRDACERWVGSRVSKDGPGRHHVGAKIVFDSWADVQELVTRIYAVGLPPGDLSMITRGRMGSREAAILLDRQLATEEPW